MLIDKRYFSARSSILTSLASQLPTMLLESSKCEWLPVHVHEVGPSVMCCLFKRVGGQEWRCYQAAIYHAHDTLSPRHPHLQAMLYRRTNTSPPAARSSIFQRHAFTATWISSCRTCGFVWKNAGERYSGGALRFSLENTTLSPIAYRNVRIFSRRQTININPQSLESNAATRTSTHTPVNFN